MTYLLPEVSLQVQASLGSVRPFLGTGVGWAAVVSGPKGIDELTLHGAVGTRVDIAPRVSIRAGSRIRAIDPWAATTADVTGGIGLRL